MLLKFLSGAAALLMIVGCAEKKEDAAAGQFDSIYNASFGVTCQNCHVAGGSAASTGLIITSAAVAYNGLMERVTNPGNPSKCTNQYRVVAGSPGKSFLLGVLFADYNTNNFNGEAGCQPSVAHLGYVSLSAAEKSAIVSWIQNGANR